MRFYKLIENSHLIAIGTGAGGIEITAEEYAELLSEIRAKAELVEKLYFGEITEADIPENWREEITRRVEERRKLEDTIA